MKTLQIIWFLLFFIGSNTIQGQTFKVYDQQKLFNSFDHRILRSVFNKDSTRLHHLVTERIQQYHTFIQKNIGGCYSIDGLEKIQEEVLLRESTILRMDSLLQDVVNYRDSISVQLTHQYIESYKEQEPAHLLAMDHVLYHETPFVDESDNILSYIRKRALIPLIIQQYTKWLRARTKHYELDDLYRVYRN